MSGKAAASPPSDAESRDLRQSLLNRSRRILGDSVELGHAPKKRARSRDPDATVPEVPDKRREQVRQAQRTHRQRTQTYIQTLEKEVLRLRNCESVALARVAELEVQVNTLLNKLIESGIPAPFPMIRLQNVEENLEAGRVLLNPNDDQEEPLVRMDWRSGSTSESGTEKQAGQPYSPFQRADDDLDEPDLPPTQTPLLQDPRVALDFILELERPCLDHLRDSALDHSDHETYVNENPEGISGHLFTASLALWQPTAPSRSSPSAYTVSQQELDRLLQTSLNIGVSGNEITPVQLWYKFQGMARVGGRESSHINLRNLGMLVGRLREHVECLHYGAVMGLEITNSILQDFFSVALA